MRVLRDRDEILLPGIPRNDGEQADVADAEPQRLFFSTERLAVVEPFPGGAKAVFCSRCKQVIDSGHRAVRCPSGRCGLWHHESAEQRPLLDLCRKVLELRSAYGFRRRLSLDAGTALARTIARGRVSSWNRLHSGDCPTSR